MVFADELDYALVTDSGPHAFQDGEVGDDAVPKRVLIIITGGTICMRPGHETGDALNGLKCTSLEAYLNSFPELKDGKFPLWDITEWSELVDSSDLNASKWKMLAEQIADNYDRYDGFVVLIGTDTLAYTSSALSFMLRNLRKPVVLTGAMLPVFHINTDARRNLCSAMLVAGFSNLKEVLVCFGGSILRGCRATKISCSQFEAFKSPKCPSLGSIGIDIIIAEDGQLSPPLALAGRSLEPKFETCPESVFVFGITPGFNCAVIRHVASLDIRPLGIILQLFGTGTGPMADPSFIRGIKFALDSGVTIVAVTQCLNGTCSLRTYANGEMLCNLGVIEGKDMTIEAAFTKLAYLFAQGYDGVELRTLMATNLRGELSNVRCKLTGQSGLHHHPHSSMAVFDSPSTASASP